MTVVKMTGIVIPAHVQKAKIGTISMLHKNSRTCDSRPEKAHLYTFLSVQGECRRRVDRRVTNSWKYYPNKEIPMEQRCRGRRRVQPMPASGKQTNWCVLRNQVDKNDDEAQETEGEAILSRREGKEAIHRGCEKC